MSRSRRLLAMCLVCACAGGDDEPGHIEDVDRFELRAAAQPVIVISRSMLD